MKSFGNIERNKIIELLYNDNEINGAINKMQPVELQSELKQEMFLVLCELDEGRFYEMHNNGILKYFLIRTMLNMIKSDRSNFYKIFRKQYEEIKELTDINETELLNFNIHQVEIHISELHWYEKELFLEYVNHNKNAVKLSKETKIPYRSLIKTISKVKKILKSKLRKNDND